MKIVNFTDYLEQGNCFTTCIDGLASFSGREFVRFESGAREEKVQMTKWRLLANAIRLSILLPLTLLAIALKVYLRWKETLEIKQISMSNFDVPYSVLMELVTVGEESPDNEALKRSSSLLSMNMLMKTPQPNALDLGLIERRDFKRSICRRLAFSSSFIGEEGGLMGHPLAESTPLSTPGSAKIDNQLRPNLSHEGSLGALLNSSLNEMEELSYFYAAQESPLKDDFLSQPLGEQLLSHLSSGGILGQAGNSDSQVDLNAFLEFGEENEFGKPTNEQLSISMPERSIRELRDEQLLQSMGKEPHESYDDFIRRVAQEWLEEEWKFEDARNLKRRSFEAGSSTSS